MTDAYVTKELEWDGGDWGEDVFYHPFMAPDKMENTVIDFDIQNLQALLKEKTNFPVEKIAKRVNAHYLDASRLIKRAFGNKIDDDFQMYNWGLTLTMDLGLAVDKLELLLNVYAKKLPRRITRADFDYIIERHSTVRHISDKHKRKLKWMDLVASFKIHTVRKPGFPDTIGKRQMVTIMDVNDIGLDLDVLRITKDMRRADVYANKLHMLLLDDPLISGNFQDAVKAGKLKTTQIGATGERLRDFEARVLAEEEEFGPLIQKSVDERMRQEFEVKAAEDARRAKARKAREDARIEAKMKEDAEKQAALARLEQIKREREEWERRKSERAIEEATAERTRLEREKELAERQRCEREAEQQMREVLVAEAAAAAEEIARREREQLEVENAAAVGMFDHLVGEERVRAEASHKLAEHRRIKAIERKRLLEETRLYAEAQLTRRKGAGAKPEHDAFTGGGEMHIPSVSGTTKTFSTPKKRRNIEDAQRRRMPAEEGDKRQPRSRSVSPEQIGTSPKPEITDEQRLLEEEERRMAELVAAELRSLEDEARRLRRDEEERTRLESVRAKLRRDEDERIRQIEAQDAQRREAQLSALQRKAAEEAVLKRRLAEQAKVKAEREARLAEAAELRRLADEHREATLNAEEDRARQALLVRPLGKSAAQLALEAKEAINKKARAEREAKQRAAKDRARKLNQDAEVKRAALISVIESKHAAARGARLKRGGTSQRDRLTLDSSELWPEGGAPFIEREGLQLGDSDDEHDLAFDAGGEGSYLYLGDADSAGLRLDDRRESLGSLSLLTESDGGGAHDADAISLQGSVDQASAAARAATEFEEIEAKRLEIEAAEAELEAEAEKERVRVEEVMRKDVELAATDAIARAEAEQAELAAATVAAAAAAEQARRKLLADAEAERLRAAIEARERLQAEARAEAMRQEAEEAAIQAALEAERARVDADERARQIAEDEAAREVERLHVLAEQLLIEKAEEEARLHAQLQLEAEAEAERAAAVVALAIVEAEERRLREEAEVIASAEKAENEADQRRAEELLRQLEQEELESTKAAEAAFAAEAERKAHTEARRLLAEREQKERERLQREAEETARRLEIEAAEQEAERERERVEAEAALQAAALVAMAAAVAEAERARFEAEVAKVRETLTLGISDGCLEEVSSALILEIGSDVFAEAGEAAALSVTQDPTTPGKFFRSSLLPPLSAQRLLPSENLTLDVPKSTDGTLRINIRCDVDDASGERGLFVHGFKANSAAEQQGQLRVGDELLAVGLVPGPGQAQIVDLGLVSLEGASASLEELILVLKGIRGPFVRMLVRRARTVVGAMAPIAPSESPTAMFDCAPSYTIIDGPEVTKDPKTAPLLLEELSALPAVDLELLVPVSDDGKLRLYIRHDDEGDAHGLFIHGFKPDSAAERQGLLRPGDELLVISGCTVKGGYLEDVVAALKQHTGPAVAMTVRRHLIDDCDMFAQERVALEIEAKRVALEAMLDEIERQQSSLDDSMGGADRKEMARRKQEQVQRLMLEQKRQRELRIVREAEERRKKAASMPNSLMNADASAAFVRRISPFEDLEISVPKTQGELRIHVKHSKRKGLFIHGFKPNSLAEQQGLLCAGDELLKVEGVDVRHTALPGLVAVLKGHTADSVRIKLRRHKYSGVEL